MFSSTIHLKLIYSVRQLGQCHGSWSPVFCRRKRSLAYLCLVKPLEVCLLTFMGLWIRSLMNISWYHYGSKYWSSIMKTSDLVDTKDLLNFFQTYNSLKIASWKLLLHLLLCSCLSHSDLSHPKDYFVRKKLRPTLGQMKKPCKIKATSCFETNRQGANPKIKSECTQRYVGRTFWTCNFRSVVCWVAENLVVLKCKT